MFHLASFGEDIDPLGAMAFIAAVREETFFTTGDDWRVPVEFTFLVGYSALVDDASGAAAQLQSPSLRIQAELDIDTIVLAPTFGSPPEIVMFPESPLALVSQESLNAQMNSDPAAAEVHYVPFWLSDGPIAPISGPFFTVGATATITQTELTWENGNLTFTTELPAGSYQVVGMRARAATGVLMRLVFQGQRGRPGVPVVNAIGDESNEIFRHGRFGVFGQFEHTNPPTLDILGGSSSAQVVMLDLLKVA